MAVFGGTPMRHRRRRQVRVGGHRLVLSPRRRAPDKFQEPRNGETNAVLIEPTFPRAKINTSSYPTQTGSRLAVTHPTPYIPPSQPRADAGPITNPKPIDLKHKVQDLLDDGLLGFEDKGPNVHSNPLPAHGAATVNTINHMDERVASPNRRRDGEPEQAVDPANRVEEESHPYPSDNITIVAYIEGNGNLTPNR
ncbi:hypothetical protein CR513_00608, partial [Mucuna pruriens]